MEILDLSVDSDQHQQWQHPIMLLYDITVEFSQTESCLTLYINLVIRRYKKKSFVLNRHVSNMQWRFLSP